MFALELKTTYRRFRDTDTVEYFDRAGNTRAIYRYEFPFGRPDDARMQTVLVGLNDGFYQEGPWETADEDLLKRLEQGVRDAQVHETSRIHCGNTTIETLYFRRTS